jgi:hypothetical protein
MVRIWAPILIAAATASRAAVTIYRAGDHGAHGTTTTSADAASYTGSAAYDPTVLAPPAPPEQLNRDYVIVVCVQELINICKLTRYHSLGKVILQELAYLSLDLISDSPLNCPLPTEPSGSTRLYWPYPS